MHFLTFTWRNISDTFLKVITCSSTVIEKDIIREAHKHRSTCSVQTVVDCYVTMSNYCYKCTVGAVAVMIHVTAGVDTGKTVTGIILIEQ